MAYQALYRKYRPTVFSDVIGQEHVTETLVNQIKNGRIGHAYLFTGSRGTGKTTCAKIFANAVNCSSSKNGSPCGKCSVCKALADAGNMDVIEIDAASNNKVDEIREIRERVKYPPVFGKYKVYIIDEVHMLTDSAFNALLKTLEEPPSFVIFILATTEVHKLPATILSRCMRFDFRLVAIDVLINRLKQVYDNEGVKYEDDAITAIAQAGEGSVRDMLSVADTCMARSGGNVTLKYVLDVLGAAGRDKIADLFCSVANGDVSGILEKINALTVLGKAPSLIGKELVSYSRDLLAIKSGLDKLVVDTKENKRVLAENAQKYSVELLVSILQIISAADYEMRFSLSPKTALESACLRASKLYSLDFNAIEERIARLERQGVSLSTASPQQKTDLQEKIPSDKTGLWGNLITHFRKSGDMDLYTLLGSHGDYELQGTTLVVYAQDETFFRFSDDDTIKRIEDALKKMGCALNVKVEKRVLDVDMDKEIERIKKMMGKNTRVETVN